MQGFTSFITKFIGILLIASLSQISCVQNVYVQGEIYYNQNCSNCHGLNGEGLKQLIPPLKGTEILHTPLEIACIIRNGKEGSINVSGQEFNQKMEGIKNLKDSEITNIINYMVSKWGNPQQTVQYTTVVEALKQCM